jgi:hypothetical protein
MACRDQKSFLEILFLSTVMGRGGVQQADDPDLLNLDLL